MEESTAHSQGIAQEAIGVIHQMLGGIRQESQQIERKKHGGKVFFSIKMTE